MHSGSLIGPEYSFHFKQIITRKNLLKIFIAFIIYGTFSVCVNLFVRFIVLPSTPMYTARVYADCLTAKDYAKAQSYYTEVPDIERLKKNEIENVLQSIYGSIQNIKISEVMNNPESGTYLARMEFIREGVVSYSPIFLRNEGSSLLGFKRDWKVVFPFATASLQVKGIEGLNIFMDGTNAGTIKDGKLDIKNIICGKHIFGAQLGGTGVMTDTYIDVDDSSCTLEFSVQPTERFREDMKNLISGFCSSWSEYCLKEDPSVMKDYLTDRLYARYANDPSIFSGSRFSLCQCSVEFKELQIENDASACYIVDEKWHLKEEITDPSFIFQANGKIELEQEQYMTWKYHVVRDSASWKIDGTEQISFTQDILN